MPVTLVVGTLFLIGIFLYGAYQVFSLTSTWLELNKKAKKDANMKALLDQVSFKKDIGKHLLLMVFSLACLIDTVRVI